MLRLLNIEEDDKCYNVEVEVNREVSSVSLKKESHLFERRKDDYVDLMLNSKKLNASVQGRANMRKYLRKLEEWSRTLNK